MNARLSYSAAAFVVVVGCGVGVASLRLRVSVSTAAATLFVLLPVLVVVGALAGVVLDLAGTWFVHRRVLARAGGAGGRRRVAPLSFTSPAAWAMTQTRAAWEATTTTTTTATATASAQSPFAGADGALSAQVDSLFALVMRDFVCAWFSQISDSAAFPNAVERTLRESLAALVGRVASRDWSDSIVGTVLPLVTGHVDAFRTAEQALRGRDLRTPLTESDELDLFLASTYAAKLHQAVDVTGPNSRPAEEAWLAALVGRILPLIMPEREVDSLAVRIIAREIVASAVILPIIDLVSDPDFWNRMIDDKAGAAIRDQQMVDQFRSALDAQSPALAASSSVRRAHRRTGEEISARTPTRQFEAFVRGIGRCESLLDARRLRSDVQSQIRKTRAVTEGRTKSDVVDGIKVADLLEYIERLYAARAKADKRIEQLGGMGASSSRYSVAGDTPLRYPRRVSLRDILLQPTSLSYFMEFQDRRRRSLRVQFWLLIEGLKAPLEDDDSDDDGGRILPAPSAATVETARSDLRMIWDTYLVSNAINANQKHVRTVRAFIEADPVGPVGATELRRVRQAVFAAQRDVLAEMEEEDFPAFEKSDLFFKALADIPEQSIDDLATVYVPEPPRARAASHPYHRPPSPVSPRHSPGSPSPPPLPYAPAITRQRTETAPPKVTLKAVFESRPTNRRSGSDEHERTLSRTGSLGSLGSLEGLYGSNKRRTTPLSDSLDFLMNSPGLEHEHDDRSPLFLDDDLSDTETPERDGTKLSDDDYVQVQTIEAIQEALSSILATDANRAHAHSEIASRHFSANPLAKKPPPLAARAGLKRPGSAASETARIPSATSTKSAPEQTRRTKGVFGDDDLDFDYAALDDDEPEEDFDPTSIRLAAPGDLQLPVEIARLASTLDKLASQEAVVGALIRKAELTGQASELKLLVKSRESLRRETRALAFQKGQYELQSESNKLVPGRTTVAISGTTEGQADGQSFQLYLVEVHQLAPDGTFASGWIVTRRYSEFVILHANLREKYVQARALDLPSKRLVTPYSEGFIEHRKSGLEKYLQALVRIPVICQSTELRSFLSQQNISLPKLDVDAGKRNASYFPGQGLVRSFYRSVTSGIDEMFTAGPASMMDTIIQRLSAQASVGVQDEDLVGELLAQPPGVGEEGLTYFTAPICELFVTLFELKEKNNWLRRQAILIILQQILGGTIERKFRDAVKMLLSPEQLGNYITVLKNGLWPGGRLKSKEPPRTPLQRANTKASANRKLSALMPDVAANLIGRTNAKHGARRLFAVLQNRRLNKHLIYSIIDEFIVVIFPELAPPPPPDPSASVPAPSGPLFP